MEDDDKFYLVIAENHENSERKNDNEILLDVFDVTDPLIGGQSDSVQKLNEASLEDVYDIISKNTEEEKKNDYLVNSGENGEIDSLSDDLGEYLIDIKVETSDSESVELNDKPSVKSKYYESEELGKPKSTETELFEYFKNKLIEIHNRVPSPLPIKPYVTKEDGQVQCKHCSLVVKNEIQGERHYRNVHGPRVHKCLACGLGFRRLCYQLVHEKRCTAPKSHVLRKARAAFWPQRGRPDRAVLQPCPVCDKPTRLSNMLAHMRVHSDPGFPCQQCPARYRTPAALRAHERAHAGLRPFICSQCARAYTSRSSLNTHIQSHQQLFTCKICGQSCTRKYSLEKHMRRHTGHKRYLCGECGKGFTSSSALICHQRRHKGSPPPHPCNLCSKRFTKMTFFRQHMQKEHGLDIITKKMFFNYFPQMDFTNGIAELGDNAPYVVRKQGMHADDDPDDADNPEPMEEIDSSD